MRMRVSLACVIVAAVNVLVLVDAADASTLNRAVATRDSMEPSVPHTEQDQAAAKKLDALRAKTGRRPNILWFVVDDMGWGDPGVYGGGEAIGAATPNIDRLANQGLRLTSTYSQPTCTPTRSAILTGRLPVRTGLTRPILAGDTLTKNPWADETSLPKMLGEAGYKTILSGKWHVGELEGMRPYEIGFDEFYGYYAAEKEAVTIPAIPIAEIWRRSVVAISASSASTTGGRRGAGPVPSVRRTSISWPAPTRTSCK